MKLFKKKEMSEDEKLVSGIVEKYLKKAVPKLIAPISMEYIIRDDENQVYICIGHGFVNISNHKFLYKKNFSLTFTENLCKEVRRAIEKERQDLKNQLFKNEVELLQNILNL